MKLEDLIDWSAIRGSKWYRPQNVPIATAGIRNCDPTAPDILFAVANNHAGELYPAAVAATPILLDIAIQAPNDKAAMAALAALDNLTWFRGEPPFDTIVYEGAGTSLDDAIRGQIEAARAELSTLAERNQRLSKAVRTLLGSLDEQRQP